MPSPNRSLDEWGLYAADLGTNLLRTRVAAGLSQEDVAYRAGLSRYTYQKYEKGESRPGTAANPTLRTLLALAQVLEVNLDKLLPLNPPDLRAR